MVEIWTGYSVDGHYLELIVKEVYNPEDFILEGSLQRRYAVVSWDITHESDNLAWIKVLYLLHLSLEQSKWGSAKMLARKLATCMTKLETSRDIMELVYWTLKQLAEDDQ